MGNESFSYEAAVVSATISGLAGETLANETPELSENSSDEPAKCINAGERWAWFDLNDGVNAKDEKEPSPRDIAVVWGFGDNRGNDDANENVSRQRIKTAIDKLALGSNTIACPMGKKFQPCIDGEPTADGKNRRSAWTSADVTETRNREECQPFGE